MFYHINHSQQAASDEKKPTDQRQNIKNHTIFTLGYGVRACKWNHRLDKFDQSTATILQVIYYSVAFAATVCFINVITF